MAIYDYTFLKRSRKRKAARPKSTLKPSQPWIASIERYPDHDGPGIDDRLIDTHSWMPSLAPMPVAVSSESPVTILISTPAYFKEEMDSRTPEFCDWMNDDTVVKLSKSRMFCNLNCTKKTDEWFLKIHGIRTSVDTCKGLLSRKIPFLTDSGRIHDAYESDEL